MREVADAIRTVTSKMQRALDTGRRSRQIDADDLIEALLAVADELDTDEPEGGPNHGPQTTG